MHKDRISRRAFALAGAAAVGLAGAPRAARAQAADWPTRAIRVIIPFAAGGGTDVLARVVLPLVQERLRQSIVIDNRPGGGSVIGTEAAARSAPDGYNFLMTDTSYQLTPLLVQRLPYDPDKDFQPVCLMAAGPVVIVVNAATPYRTLAEFIAAAKSAPGTLGVASGGAGSASHLAGELLKIEAGINLLDVAYRGGAPAMNDVIAGNVPSLFAGISTANPHLRAGRLRALAITGAARHPLAPDVPTFAEAGLPRMEASSYWGMFAPAAMPAPLVARMLAEIQAVMRTPAMTERLTEMGFTVMAEGPAGYAANIRRERDRWGAVIRAANIRIQ
ncbi:MAG: tripartite tricarboxylate transporter substrate binding protein [Alphaproteobacteria bacterium]|nr:tripartite tricarboxylate transporter substrate binding protein [Alphaproteobacteria bacterium]